MKRFLLISIRYDSSRLLLLDFGQFDKREYSYICQDFGEAFYAAMAQLSDRLQNYRKLILFLARESKHPKETCDYFREVLCRSSIGM